VSVADRAERFATAVVAILRTIQCRDVHGDDHRDLRRSITELAREEFEAVARQVAAERELPDPSQIAAPRAAA
jgi:hypothetical protein